MDKKKLELIAMGVLVAVFALSFLLNLQKTMQKAAAQKESSGPVTAPTRQGPALFIADKTEENKAKASLGWGRDPFVLEEASSGDPGNAANLRLMGITSGGNVPPRAIINNIIVSTGSSIGKFQVVAIYKDSVLITDGKEIHTLKIKR